VGVATQASALFPQVSPAQRLPSASPWHPPGDVVIFEDFETVERNHGYHMLSPDLGDE